MLFDAATANTVARTVKRLYLDGIGPNEAKVSKIPPLIVDPVCVSTSGHSLLHQSALRVLVEELFPISSLVTPNKAEAELLLAAAEAIESGADLQQEDDSIQRNKRQLNNLVDVVRAAQKLVEVAKASVLLKGGHLTVKPSHVRAFAHENPSIRVEWGETREQNMEILRIGSLEDRDKRELVVDVLVEKNRREVTLFVRPRIDSKSTHGTGCTLSAAIASFVARGNERMAFLCYVIDVL
jgi:hydroxymethylpyrimidine/phosphomethylpyrimidine kinase